MLIFGNSAQTLLIKQWVGRHSFHFGYIKKRLASLSDWQLFTVDREMDAIELRMAIKVFFTKRIFFSCGKYLRLDSLREGLLIGNENA